MNRNQILDKIIKLLKMTTSSHNGESLNSIRLANKLLKENNMTWDNLKTTKYTCRRTVRRQRKRETIRPEDMLHLTTCPYCHKLMFVDQSGKWKLKHFCD